MADEVETMVSSSDIVPWHRHGVVVRNIDNIPECIEKSGLGWGVYLQPIYIKLDKEYTKLTEGQAVIRDSDNSVLGLVGPQYTPVQNKDKFNFFQKYLDAKQASLETAGSLRNGKRTWILAKLQRKNSVIVKGDEIAKYLLLSDSYDGTMSLRVGFTPIRVVCANTMAMAHSDATSQFIRVRHSKSVKECLDTISEVVDLANEQFEATAKQYRFLASKGCNFNDLVRYVKVVLGYDKKEQKEKKGLSTRSNNIIEKIFASYEGGLGQQLNGVSGTYWGAYNAITDYITHEYGKNEERRLESQWFGQNLALNKRALQVALEFANAV